MGAVLINAREYESCNRVAHPMRDDGQCSCGAIQITPKGIEIRNGRGLLVETKPTAEQTYAIRKPHENSI